MIKDLSYTGTSGDTFIIAFVEHPAPLLRHALIKMLFVDKALPRRR